MATSTVHTAHISVMGTWGHIVIVNGNRRLVDEATARLAHLERLWSRFLPESDISRLNQNLQGPIPVAAETIGLVGQAIEAWHLTDGAFDPTLLRALESAGYDRNFPDLKPEAELVTTQMRPAGCPEISVNRRTGTIDLGPNNCFDAGGIAKGFAADIVATETIELGASGVLINVGGDMRIIGTPPEHGCWTVEIDEPYAVAAPRLTVAVPHGAIATSTPTRRRWLKGDQPQHHLIDATTNRPIENCNQLVTCIAAQAWWAEAMTKKLMAPGDPLGADEAGYAALIVDASGELSYLGCFEKYVVSSGVAA